MAYYNNKQNTKHMQTLPRREFIKGTAASVIGLALLPSCSSLDQFFIGDGPDNRDRVVILGGGAAGLMAAYKLQKNNVPYKIYEASSRIGGRVYSVSDFNATGQVIELGGEWFYEQHSAVWALIKEFKLETLQSKQGPFAAIEGRESTPHSNLVHVKAELAQNHQLQNLSVDDVLNKIKNKYDSETLLYLKDVIEFNYGERSGAISATHLLQHLDGPLFSGAVKHQVLGGNSLIFEILASRVTKAIPHRYLQLNYKLVAIKQKSSYSLLTFKNEDGRSYEIKVKKVICTLPFSVLKDIEGVKQLLSPEDESYMQDLGYGAHAKIAMDFKDRFWLKNPRFSNNKVYFNEALLTKNFYEPLSEKAAFLQAGGSTLASLQIGEAGRNTGLHTIDQAVKDLSSLTGQKVEDLYDGNYQVQNWNLNTLVKGSVSYLKPGQAFRSLFSEDNSWIFAGEHASQKWQSTLNGALESGLIAAKKIQKQKAT